MTIQKVRDAIGQPHAYILPFKDTDDDGNLIGWLYEWRTPDFWGPLSGGYLSLLGEFASEEEALGAAWRWATAMQGMR
jgi:hypothetical protein